MPGFFDALRNLPIQKEKKHFVIIQGQQKEVTLEKKLEIIKNGEENYVVKDNTIKKKPELKIKSIYPVLKNVEKGYHFVDGDIHWPEKIDEGGKAWLIEYE